MTKEQCEEFMLDALKECQFEILDKKVIKTGCRAYKMRNLNNEIILEFKDYLSIVYEHATHDFAYDMISDIYSDYQGLNILLIGDCANIKFYFTVYGASELESYVEEF